MREYGYFLRITPYKPLSFEDIIVEIEKLNIDKYIIAYEEASRPHYHLCLFSERGVENLRYRLKQCIEGQIYLSGKDIEKKVNSIAYCMKDGNFRQKNLDWFEFCQAKQMAKPKESFDDSIKKIDLTKSNREILEYILDIHVKFNRKIYKQHIKALFELIRLKKEGHTYRETLVKEFLGEY